MEAVCIIIILFYQAFRESHVSIRLLVKLSIYFKIFPVLEFSVEE